MFVTFISISSFAQAMQSKPEVIHAWYGNEDPQYRTITENTSAPVIKKLREITNKYNFIAIPGDQNKFYGFDPLPNVKKTTAIHIRHNGKEEHARAPEGNDFVYPANTDPNLVHKAFQEIKATLTTAPQPIIGQAITPVQPSGQTAASTTPPKYSEKSTALYRAVRKGDFVAARSIIEAEKEPVQLELERGYHLLLEEIYNEMVATKGCEFLEKTAQERLAFARYLIEKGFNVNRPNNKELGALTFLVFGVAGQNRGCGSKTLVDTLLGPLTHLYINAGVSLEQLQKANKQLEGCFGLHRCAVGCPLYCIQYGSWWYANIAPLIEQKLKGWPIIPSPASGQTGTSTIPVNYSEKSTALYRAVREGDFVTARTIIESEKEPVQFELEKSNLLLEELYNSEVLNSVHRAPTFNNVIGMLGTTQRTLSQSCEFLAKTAQERIAFARYLVEKGFNVNRPNNKELGALTSLANGLIYESACEGKLVKILSIPLAQLYIQAGVSLEQLQKTNAILIKNGCFYEDNYYCTDFGFWWQANIVPLIEQKLKNTGTKP